MGMSGKNNDVRDVAKRTLSLGFCDIYAYIAFRYFVSVHGNFPDLPSFSPAYFAHFEHLNSPLIQVKVLYSRFRSMAEK